MANTERLDLYKVPSNPAEQETTNFNTETMLNENWNKIDEKVAMVNEEGKVVNKDGTLAGGVSEQDFDNLKSDYMYQIPTIVDAQIRINRLSDTNRLFFKLENNLEGNITISTDSGTTEKPLVDVDENQITQLEKGFVEVVADASFFILRNRGISGADKQALIDIVNEAEANESDLKTQFIDTVNDKTGSILPVDATWFDVLQGLTNMEMGKRWVNGTTRSGLANEIAITGLPFRPSVVIVRNGNEQYVAFNTKTSQLDPDGTESIQGMRRDGSTYSTNRLSIGEDGFTGTMTTSSKSFNWVAIE